MAILKTKKVWKAQRTLPPKTTLRPCELTRDEQDNVWAAALKLKAELRTWQALAAALGMKRVTLVQVKPGERGPTVGLAFRLARVAGASIDDVLTGAFARGRCPTCGK